MHVKFSNEISGRFRADNGVIFPAQKILLNCHPGLGPHQQCYREVDCVEPGRGDVPRELRGRVGGRGRRGGGAGRRRPAAAHVGSGEEGDRAEDDGERRRDLVRVAHVDVAGRHEEREDGQEGERQAQR